MGKTYHAVIESENLDSWTWFLSHLKIAIPESVGMTLISDRDKGLLGAEEAVYGNSIQRLICCFHLKGNVCKWYSNTVASYFWAIANAYSREQYTIAMAALEQYNEGAAIYLKAIDSKLWVTAFYIGPYYGHKTSNVVESTNKVLFKEQRELPILDLLDAIWQYVMNKRCKHALQLPHKFIPSMPISNFSAINVGQMRIRFSFLLSSAAPLLNATTKHLSPTYSIAFVLVDIFKQMEFHAVMHSLKHYFQLILVLAIMSPIILQLLHGKEPTKFPLLLFHLVT